MELSKDLVAASATSLVLSISKKGTVTAMPLSNG